MLERERERERATGNRYPRPAEVRVLAALDRSGGKATAQELSRIFGYRPTRSLVSLAERGYLVGQPLPGSPRSWRPRHRAAASATWTLTPAGRQLVRELVAAGELESRRAELALTLTIGLRIDVEQLTARVVRSVVTSRYVKAKR